MCNYETSSPPCMQEFSDKLRGLLLCSYQQCQCVSCCTRLKIFLCRIIEFNKQQQQPLAPKAVATPSPRGMIKCLRVCVAYPIACLLVCALP